MKYLFLISSELNPSNTLEFFSLSELKTNELLKQLIEKNSTQISIYLESQHYKDWLSCIILLKKYLSDIKINIYTSDCLFENLAPLLKENIVYSLSFACTEQNFYDLGQNKIKSQQFKKVYYSNQEYSYHLEQNDLTPSAETLLVLMPAWNNFFPPYGLAHIAGSLKSANLSYEILDLNNLYYNEIKKQPQELQKYGNIVYWQNKSIFLDETQHTISFVFDALKNKILDTTKFIGFSVFGPNQHATELALAFIRKHYPQIKLFCGGPQITESVAEQLIKNNLIDAAVIGEGEESCIDLLLQWRGNPNLQDPVAGVILNNNSRPVVGPLRPLISLDKLPEPNFSKFPMFQYERNNILPIYSSRGCVAKCSFCAETIFWKKFRAVNPQYIVHLMQTSIKNYGINSFYFNDSLMNGSHKLLEDLCDLIISKKLIVKFEGYARFDTKMTPELLNKLAQAGCQQLVFGFESGSQKIVDLMNKKVFVNNYESILSLCKKAGISCQVCIIIGFPGETWWDFISTLFKAIKMHPYISSLNLSIMEISQNSLIEKDFAKYNIVNAQNRYWRTRYWTNFFLLRLVRFYIFKTAWQIITKKGISLNIWDRGYLMITKKISSWLKLKFKLRNQIQ